MKLAPEAETELRRACDRLRRRGTVNIDYGFDKKLPYGRGLSVLLYGPSGTGKTMAAKVMANDLGLDLYCIDLAQISSKYIGETGKTSPLFLTQPVIPTPSCFLTRRMHCLPSVPMFPPPMTAMPTRKPLSCCKRWRNIPA